MENFDNHNSFENFLKESTTHFKMYPDDKIWNQIHSKLHKPNYKLVAFYFILGLLFTVLLIETKVISFHPNNNELTTAKKINTAEFNPTKNNEIFVEKNQIISTSTVNNHSPKNKELVAENLRFQDRNLVSNLKTIHTHKLTSFSKFKNNFWKEGRIRMLHNQQFVKLKSASNLKNSNSKNYDIYFKATNNNQIYFHTVVKNIGSKNINADLKPSTILVTPVCDSRVEDEILVNHVNKVESKNKNENDVALLSIESVLNSYQGKKHKNKFNLEMAFAPNINYRNLNNKNGVSNNLNNMVYHKPDLGGMIEFTVVKKVLTNMKLFAGLQFSVSRYQLKAFNTAGQMTRLLVTNGQPVQAWTSYQSAPAPSYQWLTNTHIAVSLPVGIAYNLISNTHSAFGVSASVSPMRMIIQDAYLLSTDMKNYVIAPSLLRKWNLNTGFQIFYASNGPGLQWKIGPVVNYQLMSTFQNKYPIKENLFNFGLQFNFKINH